MKKYYPVVYLKNGDACVGSACETEQECVKALAKACSKYHDKVKATTYLYREAESVEDIFGTPRSRDLMFKERYAKELRND